MRPERSTGRGPVERLEVVIVGAGFAGLYMLHRLSKAGFKARILEADDEVGGTWFQNRYPGCRCDVESLEYSYSFDPELEREWQWSERFATQPEILRYIQHVTERFDLRKDITFNTRVTAARYDDDAAQWTIETNRDVTYSAPFCIMATGSLSAAQVPEFEGADSFAGQMYHTADWPREPIDFSGKTVGVIGTGSSGIQCIPEIAKAAERLLVFQRTPSFSLPARNAPLSEEKRAHWKDNAASLRQFARDTSPGLIREFGTVGALDVTDTEREAEFERRWAKGGGDLLHAYTDIMRDERANTHVADFIRRKIKSIVEDPDVAEKLTPVQYPVGSKRVCLDSDYYATFNRPNVSLVSLKDSGIERITPAGVIVAGKEYELDVLVLATGFDAMTGSLLKMNIEGRDGLLLSEKWSAGPLTYLGLMAAGFPNLFFMATVGSPSVLSNMVLSIEQHVEWIGDCLEYLRVNHITSMEADAEAEAQWVAHGNELANGTLLMRGASWYLGANVPGKPRVFMPYLGGVKHYRETCQEIAADGYRGFVLKSEPVAAHAS